MKRIHKKPRRWPGLSLILLFAATVAFVGATQALAPASASAFQPVCDDESPWDCNATPPGGGDGTGDVSWGDGDNSGWGDDVGWGDGSDTGDNSGWGDDVGWGDGSDTGDPGDQGDGGASTSDPGCAYYEECGDPCGYGGACSDDSSDGGFPGGEGPGGSAGGGSVPGQGPPEPCLDYRLAMDAAITRSDYDTYEEQQAIQAYYRCMEDTKQGAGIVPRTDPAGTTSSTSAPSNTTAARHAPARRTNRSRKHRAARHALTARGAR